MLSPSDLRPAPVAPALDGIREVAASSAVVRSTTAVVGRDYDWPSQHWDERQWQAYLERPHLRHWVALVNGAPAGLLSLDLPPGREVEIDTFGLVPDYIGQGIGGHFLTVGVRLAWTVVPLVSRVWLHTSSQDHANALPNYERRGFRRYRVD
jgi:GNAT superfamily N-acetyltransferase